MMLDYLVLGHVLDFNPASAVRAPKLVVDDGSTPFLEEQEARKLLDSIDTSHVVGLRDRALIALMIYSFARVAAAVGMRVKHYYTQGKRSWFVLPEKGGKRRRVPAHHKAQEYLDAYIQAAGIADEREGWLFRATGGGRQRILTENQLNRNKALRMIKRRAKDASLPQEISCHTFRATGITSYLLNDGNLEVAQRIAGHRDPRTTKLYDRRHEKLNLDEIERIRV